MVHRMPHPHTCRGRYQGPAKTNVSCKKACNARLSDSVTAGAEGEAGMGECRAGREGDKRVREVQS